MTLSLTRKRLLLSGMKYTKLDLVFLKVKLCVLNGWLAHLLFQQCGTRMVGKKLMWPGIFFFFHSWICLNCAILTQDAETICSTIYMCDAIQHQQLVNEVPEITSSVKKDGQVLFEVLSFPSFLWQLRRNSRLRFSVARHNFPSLEMNFLYYTLVTSGDSHIVNAVGLKAFFSHFNVSFCVMGFFGSDSECLRFNQLSMNMVCCRGSCITIKHLCDNQIVTRCGVISEGSLDLKKVPHFCVLFYFLIQAL